MSTHPALATTCFPAVPVTLGVGRAFPESTQRAAICALWLTARQHTRKRWSLQPFMVLGNVLKWGPEIVVQSVPVNARGSVFQDAWRRHPVSAVGKGGDGATPIWSVIVQAAFGVTVTVEVPVVVGDAVVDVQPAVRLMAMTIGTTNFMASCPGAQQVGHRPDEADFVVEAFDLTHSRTPNH